MDRITAGELASDVGGVIIGDAEIAISGANPPRQAVDGDVTMLDDPERADSLVDCRAVAVVVSQEIEATGLVQILVPDVHQAFIEIVSRFRQPLRTGQTNRVHPSAIIHESAEIADNVTVGPGCVIGPDVSIGDATTLMPNVTIMSGCQIGSDVTLFSGVVLYENTVIEDRVRIHAGSVLGAHGFGYRQVAGRHEPTGQLGSVHIEADVEIGASVTIDRGTYGATRIGCGTKIDNQVMIAHNCQIGRHNLICSQVGIAGSCTTGDYVILAGQVGLKDHVNLADQVIVGAQAGIMSDCEAGQVYLGSPATTQKEQMQIFAMWRRLPEMRRSIKKLEQTIARLVQANQNDTTKAA